MGLKLELPKQFDIDDHKVVITGRISGYEGYAVTVHRLRMSDDSICGVKGCDRPDEYGVFCWDGQPSLSRLMDTCCEQHLPDITKKAWAENDKMKIKYKKKEG